MSRKGHKPDCKCLPCVSRRGAEEAHTIPTGDGRTALAPLVGIKEQVNRDLPPLVGQSRKARDRVAEWIAIRASEPHLRQKDIAERMGIKAHTLNNLIQNAQKKGWLVFDNPLDKIEYQIVPKVVDNLIEFLDQKDKTVTLETAKGTIFRQYQASKGIQDVQNNVLALKIEMADSTAPVKIVTGQIVGQPRSIENS